MAPYTIVLGNKNYSSWSLRPWLAVKRTGAAFDEIMIPLRQSDTSDQIRRHSPAGKVPILKHGGLVLWESLAICEYLAEAFPEARLWPEDRAARAHARAVSHEMHSGFADLRRVMPMDIRGRWPLAARLDDAGQDVRRVTAIWRECRERYGVPGANGQGNFLYGEFSIADAMFAPVATRFVTYSVPLDAASAAYVAAIGAWPAMREWRAAAQTESWVIQP